MLTAIVPMNTKNGIIGILCGNRKAIDLKITNSLPMLVLRTQSWLHNQNGFSMEISSYQHFSIPSDLAIHLTKQQAGEETPKHLFFDSPSYKSILEDSSFRHLHLFTFVGAPIQMCPQLQGTWDGAAIVNPRKDMDFHPDKTRAFIDFFVHSNARTDFINYPLVHRSMRLAYDNSGCMLGAFPFDGLQRKPRVTTDLFFSIRVGYIEMDVTDNCHIFVDYELRQRNGS